MNLIHWASCSFKGTRDTKINKHILPQPIQGSLGKQVQNPRSMVQRGEGHIWHTHVRESTAGQELYSVKMITDLIGKMGWQSVRKKKMSSIQTMLLSFKRCFSKYPKKIRTNLKVSHIPVPLDPVVFQGCAERQVFLLFLVCTRVFIITSVTPQER